VTNIKVDLRITYELTALGVTEVIYNLNQFNVGKKECII
jgi:hypothetical protein